MDETGASVQKNAYDGLSRRITKESGGTVTHTYWSDRWKPLEERIGSATTAAHSYLWGERPGHRDELVLRDRDTDGNGSLDERLYATMDYFNGTSVLNTSGVVQERYAYSAFGVRRIMAADFSPRSSSSYVWEFGFQGQFLDSETGWYNYGYRFYVPLLGRWINRDPIGERGGVYLYSFLRNRSLNHADRFGLRIAQCCLPDGQHGPPEQYNTETQCCVDSTVYSKSDIEAEFTAIIENLKASAKQNAENHGMIPGWNNCSEDAARAMEMENALPVQDRKYWTIGLEGGATYFGRNHHVVGIYASDIARRCGFSDKTYDPWNGPIGGPRDDIGELDDFKSERPYAVGSSQFLSHLSAAMEGPMCLLRDPKK